MQLDTEKCELKEKKRSRRNLPPASFFKTFVLYISERMEGHSLNITKSAN